jgi:hypothetical protein
LLDLYSIDKIDKGKINSHVTSRFNSIDGRSDGSNKNISKEDKMVKK